MAGVDPISLTKKDKDELIEMIETQNAKIEQLETNKKRGKNGVEETIEGSNNIVNAFDPRKSVV